MRTSKAWALAVSLGAAGAGAGGCAPARATRAPTTGIGTSPARAPAYDETRSEGLSARVVCGDGTASVLWIDVAYVDASAQAARSCADEVAKSQCPAGVPRTVRPCGPEPLGPAPLVDRGSVLLVVTSPLDALDVLPDGAGLGEARGYTSVPSAAACEPLRAAAEAAARREDDERVGRFVAEQRAELERQRDEARAQREALAERPKALHRGTGPRGAVDANVAALEDLRLAQRIAQAEQQLELLNGVAAPEPRVHYACVVPGSTSAPMGAGFQATSQRKPSGSAK